MAAGSSDSLERDRLLNEAIVAYMEAVESGEVPDEQEWLARYPEVAAELAECLHDQQKVFRWIEPLRDVARAASIGMDTRAWDLRAELERSSELPAIPLDDYELLEEIARGGMGVVYKARQLSLGRVVALKMIRTGQLASAAEVQRFRAEAEAAASLDHPHIMPIYDVGESEGRPYFSMKLIDGGSLSEHLADFVSDQHATARLMSQVARAVHHAHQRGILHRDLKPANVLLDGQRQPYVADFGLARPVQGDSGITQSGAIVGTPSYMAPEQAAGQKSLTTAADVYSLGSVLYAMLTGRPPFQTDTPLETVRLVLEEEPSRPRLVDPRVARDLETICLKCLHKEPERRYGSAEALAEDLERWLAGEPIEARRSRAWERAWKKAKRNPWAAALVAVSTAALVGLGVAGVILQEQRARVAEQELAEQQRRTAVFAEAQNDFREAQVERRRGNLQQAQNALLTAAATSGSEPALRNLTAEIQTELDDVTRALAAREARQKAEEGVRQFFQHRDEALFYGTDVDLANAVAVQRAAEKALGLFGLTAGGKGGLVLDGSLNDSEEARVTDGCYELLLILAETFAERVPPEIERAKQMVEQAGRLREPTKAYYLRHGRYLEMLGDAIGAEADYERAETLASTSALDQFLVGEFLLREKNLAAARRAFEQALQYEPNHFWAHYFMAFCYLPGEAHAAKAHLSACLSQREFYGAYLLRGIAHVQLEEYAEAEDDFAEALRLAAKEPEWGDELRTAALVNRGLLRTRQRIYAEAIEDLREAIALQPQAYQAYWNLAKVYQEQGRLDAAITALSNALEAAESPGVAGETEVALLYDYRARVHLERADEVAALADVKRALEVKAFAESYVLLGRLLQGAGRYREAARAFEDAMKVSPFDARTFEPAAALRGRGAALVLVGKHREAAACLEGYLAGGGEADVEVYRLLGFARSQYGDYTGAISDYTVALRQEPNNPQLYTLRGWVYYWRKALDLALEDFERAIVLDPSNGDPYNGRGYVRVKRGDAAGAVVAAETALRTGPANARLFWNAARIHALAMGLVEGGERREYHDRAVELLGKALELVSPAERAGFWQKYVEEDTGEEGALGALRDSAEFRRLAAEYGAGVEEAVGKRS